MFLDKDLSNKLKREMGETKYRIMLAQIEIPRIKGTLNIARVRCLSFDTLIDQLKNIIEIDNPLIIDRLCELEFNSSQEKLLTRILNYLSTEGDKLPYKEKVRLDRYIRRLLKHISPAAAAIVAGEYFDHDRKGRRKIAYEVFRHVGLTRELSKRILEIYQKRKDQDYLELIARFPIGILDIDYRYVLAELESKYWRARVIQSLLEKKVKDIQIIANKYPFEFVHAVGRTKDPVYLPIILSIFSDNKSDVEFLSIFTLCLGVLGAAEQIQLVEIALSDINKWLESNL